MAITEIVQLIQRKGLKADLPALDEAELGFATDTKELFVGSSTGNILLARASDIPVGGGSGSGPTVADSVTNGYIVVDGVQLQVYDDTALAQALAGKSDINHNHTGVYEPVISTKNTAFNKSFGSVAGTVAEGNHTHSELHTHSNKLTLDKLSDNGTSLLFNGASVGGSGGSGATSLDGLTDVDTSTTAPVEGNVLKYIGGLWKPGTDNAGSGGGGSADTFNVYNAVNYGVPTDGTTDAQPAIQALVQLVASVGGGIIYLPKGIYMLDNSIFWKNKVSLYGDGIGKTILAPRRDESLRPIGTSGNASVHSAITWDKTGTLGTSTDVFVQCHFRDFEIDGTNIINMTQYKVGTKGIFIQYMRDCSFKNLYIHDTVATGLGIDFLDRTIIENVYAKNCGRGFGVMSGGTLGGAGIGIGTGGMANENLVIANCQTDGCGSYGIFTEDQSIFDGSFTYKGQGIIIANCIVKNTRNHGFGVKGGKGITISNCQSYGNTISGIYLNTVALEDVMVTNNVIYNNGQDGIKLEYLSGVILKDFLITNNIIRTNTNMGVRMKIGTFESITFSDNQIIENGSNGFYIENSATFIDGLTIKSNTFRRNGGEAIFPNNGVPTMKNVFIENNQFIDNSNTASNKYAIYLWANIDGGRICDNTALDTKVTGSKKQNGFINFQSGFSISNAVLTGNDVRFNINTAGYTNATILTIKNTINDVLSPMGALYAPNTTINRYVSLPKEVGDFTGSTSFVIDVKFKYIGSNIVFLSKHNTVYTTDTRPKGWYFAVIGAKLKLEGSSADATNSLNILGSTTLVSGTVYWARVVLDGVGATLKIQLSTDGVTYTDETVTGTLTAANVSTIVSNADDMPTKIGVRYAGSTGFTDYYKNSEIHFISLFKAAAITTGTPTMQYKFTNYGMNRAIADEILGANGTSYGMEQVRVY